MANKMAGKQVKMYRDDWVWAPRASLELVQLWKNPGLPQDMRDYARSVVRLGRKAEVEKVMGIKNNTGELMGIGFKRHGCTTIDYTYMVPVGDIWFGDGDDRNNKYILNFTMMEGSPNRSRA